jgi:hypothetical protein
MICSVLGQARATNIRIRIQIAVFAKSPMLQGSAITPIPCSERQDDFMAATAQRATPHVEIFWLVQTSNGEAKLLAAGRPLDEARRTAIV